MCMKEPCKRSCFPCQWNAWKIDVNGYDRCKDCWRKGLTAEDRNRLAWHKSALEIDLEDWGKHQEDFIVAWVEFVAGDRKYLSHRGGLWSRRRGDPVCWTDSAGLSTFDPGNWIYRDAVTKCVGDILFTAYGMRNEETVGDVIESLFGYVLLAEDLSLALKGSVAGRSAPGTLTGSGKSWYTMCIGFTNWKPCNDDSRMMQ